MVKKEKILEKARRNPQGFNFLSLKAYYPYVTGHLKDKQVVIDFGIHHSNIVYQFNPEKTEKPKVIK